MAGSQMAQLGTRVLNVIGVVSRNPRKFCRKREGRRIREKSYAKPTWLKCVSCSTAPYSQLCHYGVPHPALKRIKQVAVRLPEEGQKGLVQQYLDHGSGMTERLMQAIFQARPELYDWAFEQCRGYAAVARLAKIKRLTGEQIGRLEPSVKRRLLESDLSV